ncbi:MAG: putative RDD family membrane protein YckC [Sulfurimonas sp.]|jgi:uncharacterized RDD family membrane protein YckC|uniref:RDD family protein n=1 Tax=Sulfurimonas sp. TaxID=2022749 RepID=UPI0039E296D7
MRFRDLKKQSNKNNQTTDKKQTINPTYYIYRIKALIVDLFMIYMPIMYIMTYGVLDGKEALQGSSIAPLIATIIYGFIYAAFLSRTGQTPGKKAYEIKVVDSKTFENIGFFRAFLRFFVFLFTVTTLIGLFLPVLRKDNKLLHDILLSTTIKAFPSLEK